MPPYRNQIEFWLSSRRDRASPTFYPLHHLLYYTNTTLVFTQLSAVDGYNLVPNIRPLETLHNSLSLNQITDLYVICQQWNHISK